MQENRSHKQTILVVDDTPDNLFLVSNLLKDLYSVKVANSGETLEKGQSCKYNKDNLTDEELNILLDDDFEGYSIDSDYSDFNYIRITAV